MKYSILKLNKKDIKDFAKERNLLLKKAKTKWVFFLDTDEEMSPELKKEIDAKIKSNNFDGYLVKRNNYFLGKYSGTDIILRLGKKNAGKWERAVHETWQIKGPVGLLENPLIHNTASTVFQMIAKINFYSTLHAKANIIEGKRTNIFKILFYPKVKFLLSLISGRGLVMSILQAFHSFLAWSKEWEIQK